MLQRDNGITSARRSAAAFVELIEERVNRGDTDIEASRALRYATGILGDLDAALAEQSDKAAPVYYSTSDIAAQLDCSVAWIRRLADREQIGVKRATGGQGSRTYSREDLAKFKELIASGKRGRPVTE
tara:strand:- start:8 stop:391 length:384 start_codon:yes stop_codon:yes gene_type:complete